MVTVQILVLHLVDICSLVQKTISRSLAGWSRFVAGRSRCVAGRKNNKSGGERGAKADSRPEPRTKVNRTFPKKKLNWQDS